MLKDVDQSDLQMLSEKEEMTSNKRKDLLESVLITSVFIVALLAIPWLLKAVFEYGDWVFR